jgi:hypothetical protein
LRTTAAATTTAKGVCLLQPWRRRWPGLRQHPVHRGRPGDVCRTGQRPLPEPYIGSLPGQACLLQGRIVALFGLGGRDAADRLDRPAVIRGGTIPPDQCGARDLPHVGNPRACPPVIPVRAPAPTG